MSNFDEFKKKDKSEKVVIVHIEPIRQLIRFTDLGFDLFKKIITTTYTKTNQIPCGFKRNGIDLIDYDTDIFLEDENNNPILTGDDQFIKLVI